MRRLALPILLLFSLVACRDDRVDLRRGPLGPASYTVRLGVTGGPALRTEEVSARLSVEMLPRGANLVLRVEGFGPISAELSRRRDGQLSLESVENVPPRSAGEADLASIVGQLDPPLPVRPVRIGDRWSASRTIRTDSLDARIQSSLRLVRFRRVGGSDAAELGGRVRGRLRTVGPSGAFEGSVDGETTIYWGLDEGRVVASETRLGWSVPGSGRLRIDTVVRPR